MGVRAALTPTQVLTMKFSTACERPADRNLVRPVHESAGALGGLLIGCIGVLLPPVMFWGEWEIQTIASGAPLPHIWPKGMLLGNFSRKAFSGASLLSRKWTKSRYARGQTRLRRTGINSSDLHRWANGGTHPFTQFNCM